MKITIRYYGPMMAWYVNDQLECMYRVGTKHLRDVCTQIARNYGPFETLEIVEA